MNVRDLLAHTLSSLERLPGDPARRITLLLPSASLGRIAGEPSSAQQALTLLLRGALRIAGQARFVVQAERFTDDSTDLDWVEISIQSPVSVAPSRHQQVEISTLHAGGWLEFEAEPGMDGFVYRIYLPCSPVLVPFPAAHGRATAYA